jgi:hypothetical protein
MRTRPSSAYSRRAVWFSRTFLDATGPLALGCAGSTVHAEMIMDLARLQGSDVDQLPTQQPTESGAFPLEVAMATTGRYVGREVDRVMGCESVVGESASVAGLEEEDG